MIARGTVALFALALMAGAVPQARPSTASPSSRVPAIVAQYASLPLRFEPVVAHDGAPAFVARAAKYAVAVARDGAALAFADGSTIRIRLVDADRDVHVAGIAPTDARIHRLRHGDARDQIDVRTYERVAIANVQPGLDVAFHGHGGELEYDVVVAPGTDPSRFGFRIDGSNAVALNNAGDLTLATAAGTLTVKRPVAYQDAGDARAFVSSNFVVDDDRVVRIRVGDYDRARTLVIDPVVSYATFLGGSSYEQATAVAVDSAGNAYVTGYTASTDFPLVNAYDRSLGRKGDVDVFVSKLNPTGTGLVWSTYIGGTASSDRAVGIAVDASGSAYITGTTSGADFPTSATAWQTATTSGGGFVAKLSPAGNALVYSTYVANATPSSIGVDANGNAYVTGSAASASFATTANALQRSSSSTSGSTAFLLKLNAAGTAPSFATFLGGSSSEDATSLALDGQGNAYVGGWTTSADFPVRNPLQPAKRSAKDGFVAKIAGDGSQIIYATFLGGSLDDAVNAIAVDRTGSAYVAGETYSGDFPVVSGFQMQKAGRLLVSSSLGNAFVAKLSPTGNALVYGSFLGGEICQFPCQSLFGVPQIAGDVAYGIAVDSAGHAYVTGLANSWTFPLVDSTSPRKQQDNEDSAFALKVSISGGSLLWSTFLRTGYGESDNHWTRFPPGAASAVALDANDAAYVVGDSDSASNFQPTSGAFQASASGPAATVVKFAPAQAMTLTTTNPATDTQTPITLTATVSGPPVSGTVTFMDGASWIGSGFIAANSASATLTLPAGIHSLTALLQLPGANTDAPPIMQVVDVPLACN